MKIGFDKQKTAEALANFTQNTAELGRKVSEGVKSNLDVAVEKGKSGINAAIEKGKSDIGSAVEKSKNDSYLRRLKKYNPLFPDVYQSESFNKPNMIIIVDDAVRRGIDVCEGAIGWLEARKDMEVLCLYDEAVEFSGISFVPFAACDAVYYVDNFDRNKYINVDSIFAKAHEERLAELEHIAYCLGAKRCTIEITENLAVSDTKSKSVKIAEGFGQAKSTEGMEQSASSSDSKSRSGRIVTEFAGERKAQRPELKWFAHEDTILKFIDMCCNGENAVKTKELELLGASHATMSQKAAYSIDASLGKVKTGGGITMEAQANKEHQSKLKFKIEF